MKIEKKNVNNIIENISDSKNEISESEINSFEFNELFEDSREIIKESLKEEYNKIEESLIKEKYSNPKIVTQKEINEIKSSVEIFKKAELEKRLLEEGERIARKLIKEISDYVSQNPINYFVTELPDYLKPSRIIKYEDKKIHYQFLKMVNFFFNKVKKENYEMLVKEREAYEMIDELIKSKKFAALSYVLENQYKLTKNQEFMLRESVRDILKDTKSNKNKIEELITLKELPLLVKQYIILNSDYQDKVSYDESMRKIQINMGTTGLTKESKHLMLQELIKTMNNIDVLNNSGTFIYYSIVKPLKWMFAEHISFFNNDDYVEFTKYLVKFTEYVKKNDALKDQIKYLERFLSDVIEARNLSYDLLVEDLKPVMDKIKVLQNKSNDEMVSTNKITEKNFVMNSEFNDILEKIKKGYNEVRINKDFLSVEVLIRMERLVEENLSSMIDIYSSFKKGDEKTIQNFKGQNVEDLMRDTLNDILSNINSSIDIINSEKADFLLVKSNQIRSLGSKL